MFDAIRMWNRARVERRRARRRPPVLPPQVQMPPPASEHPHPSLVAELTARRFPSCRALRVFSVPTEAVPRISIVTDSISDGSFYGGVGTALILGLLWAEQLGARLRVVTRTQPAQATNLHHLFHTYGLSPRLEVEFAFADCYDADNELGLLPGELFLTTSWWTTAATMASVPHESIVYLLQEDERMFYPFGDDRLRCEQALRASTIRFVVNTKLMFDHLVGEGFDNIERCGVHFEPAFPTSVFYPRERPVGDKPTLVFYARPHHARNLFQFGLEVLQAAVQRGLLDPQVWRVLFVGKDVPAVDLGEHCIPEIREGMSWTDYAQLVGSVDVGFTLMYTPHPSYPPLDLAASGAVAVTNRYAGKQTLEVYSRNIICGDLDRESMLAALAEGMALSQDREQRARNRACSSLQKDWHAAFAPVLRWLSASP